MEIETIFLIDQCNELLDQLKLTKLTLQITYQLRLEYNTLSQIIRIPLTP